MGHMDETNHMEDTGHAPGITKMSGWTVILGQMILFQTRCQYSPCPSVSPKPATRNNMSAQQSRGIPINATLFLFASILIYLVPIYSEYDVRHKFRLYVLYFSNFFEKYFAIFVIENFEHKVLNTIYSTRTSKWS